MILLALIINFETGMKKIFLLLFLFTAAIHHAVLACDCAPASNEDKLDEKIYSGENYVFYTAEVLSVRSAFHLEVTVLIDKIYYGGKHIHDITKPITVYFDLRSECAVSQTAHIKDGTKLFITSAWNAMGKMLLTNNCDAYFPHVDITTHQLHDYLEGLKNVD